jgi:tRNA-dihydrouridine synthase
MSGADSFSVLMSQAAPVLALAPMQDVTDLPFIRIMKHYGGPDLYFTEYFRVHVDSNLNKGILSSITENPTGRPIIAQMIGNDIPSLVRTAKELLQHPVAGIDLNLGCPAPVVYKKCAGGGLLRDLPRIDSILGALRGAISGRFTVKTRIGFEDERTLHELLPLFQKHSLDLLTVHGRTVLQMYRPGVRYDLIALASAEMNCPVLANGDVSTPTDAERVLKETKVRGLMIGRGAIRNPWIFTQIRAHLAGETRSSPLGHEVLEYIRTLYDSVCDPTVNEVSNVTKMKRYLNFIGAGVGSDDQFLNEIRRAQAKSEFFAICAHHLDHREPVDLIPRPKTS